MRLRKETAATFSANTLLFVVAFFLHAHLKTIIAVEVATRRARVFMAKRRKQLPEARKTTGMTSYAASKL